jgi:hypothetical protein
MPWGILVPLIAYPAYLTLMAATLAACGVSRREIAIWALRRAGRQRLTDLIRAARGMSLAGEAEQPNAGAVQQEAEPAKQ